MPGSPPSSTSEPGTTPPPSTRSNSPMPDERRTAFAVSTSAYSFAAVDVLNCVYRLFAAVPGATSGAARSSTNEFHAPHSTHFPIHFGDWAPHSWQTKTTLGGFTRTLFQSAIQYDRRPRRGWCRWPPPSRVHRSAATTPHLGGR